MKKVMYGKNEVEGRSFHEEFDTKDVMDVFFSGVNSAIDEKAKQRAERDLGKPAEKRKTEYEHRKELLEQYKSKIACLHNIAGSLKTDEDLRKKRAEYEKLIDVLKEVGVSHAPLKKGYNSVFKDRNKNFKAMAKDIKEVQGLPINNGIALANGEMLEFQLDGYDVGLDSENFERLSSTICSKHYKREKEEIYTPENYTLSSDLGDVESVKKFLKLPINREYLPDDVSKSEENIHDLVQGRNDDYQLVNQYSEYLNAASRHNEEAEKIRYVIDLITNSDIISDSAKNKLISTLNKKMKLARSEYEKARTKADKYREETGIDRHLSNAKNYETLFDSMTVVEQPFADATPEQVEFLEKNKDYIRDIWRGETYKYCDLEKTKVNDAFIKSLAANTIPPSEASLKDVENVENNKRDKVIENEPLIQW